MVFSVTKHRERQDSAVARSLPRWRLEVPFGIGEYLKTATANSKLDEPWGNVTQTFIAALRYHGLTAP